MNELDEFNAWEMMAPVVSPFAAWQAARALYAAPIAPRADGLKAVPVEPTREMLIAARDWSHKKFGQPIGNDAAIGCWLAMFEAAPRADADTAGAKPLTDAEIEAGWRYTFSTDNPYCPCNLKSFTKAVRWAERAKEKK